MGGKIIIAKYRDDKYKICIRHRNGAKLLLQNPGMINTKIEANMPSKNTTIVVQKRETVPVTTKRQHDIIRRAGFS